MCVVCDVIDVCGGGGFGCGICGSGVLVNV